MLGTLIAGVICIVLMIGLGCFIAWAERKGAAKSEGID